MQGPPGTGKTHTIVAIASAVLFGNASGGVDAARTAPSNTAAAKAASGRRGGDPPQPPPHCRLLVCAQSNAAVDELVSRLAQQVLIARFAHNTAIRRQNLSTAKAFIIVRSPVAEVWA